MVCFCLTGFLQAQKYANNIQLQSVTDTVTRPIPLNTQVTLLDSARLYLITASQPVGTSMADIIAAGEYQILSNDKASLDSTYVKITNITDPKDYIDSLTSLIRSRTIVADDTLLVTDLGKVLYVNSETDVDITIDLNANVAFPVNATVVVWQEGVGDVNILIVDGGTLQSKGGMTTIGAIETGVVLTQRSINTWKIAGSLK